MAKRYLSLILALGLLISFLSSSFSIVSGSMSSDELVTNGGFETGDISGWSNMGPVNATVSSTDSYSGSYSVLMGGYTAIIFEQVLNVNSSAQALGNLTCYLRVPSYPDIDPYPFPIDLEDPSLSVSVYYADGGSESEQIPISTAEWFAYEFPINTTKRLSKIGFSSYSITEVYLDGVSLPGTLVYQSDLILTDHDVFVIENDWFHINGSILVEGNATLILRNATLDFMSTDNGIYLRNPSMGHPRLLAEDAAIVGMRYSRHYSNSVLVFKNCSVSGFLHFYDRTNVTIIDSQMSRSVRARENATVTITNSTVEAFGLTSHSTNASVSHLAPGTVEFWNFWSNCSVTILPGGQAPKVTLTHTTIQTWELSFQDASHAEIAASVLEHLHANSVTTLAIANSTISDLELYNFVIARSLNVTCSQIRLYNTAKAYLSWFLAVQIVDTDSQPVPLANVTVTHQNTTLIAAKVANAEGWTTFTLLEKMLNVTGTYPEGNYTVDADYGGYTNSASVELIGNLQLVLPLPFLIPEFPSPVALLMLLSAAALAMIGARRRRYSAG